MRKSIAYIFICLFAVVFYANAQIRKQTASAEENYILGVKLFEIGRAADALPLLQKAASVNRDSYLYRFYAARAAHFSENYQVCVENFTEALRLRPQDQPAQALYLWRAECSVELGNRQAAQNDFAKAMELQPGLKWAYSTRIFYDTGNRCAGSADARYTRAEAFYEVQKIYEAYRDLYIALKCDPKHLPSLKLRLKIESADDNLSVHAKVHRVQLEQLENPGYKTYAAMSAAEKSRLVEPGGTTVAATQRPTPAPSTVAAEGQIKGGALYKLYLLEKPLPAATDYASLEANYHQQVIWRTNAVMESLEEVKKVTGNSGSASQQKLQAVKFDLTKKVIEARAHIKEAIRELNNLNDPQWRQDQKFYDDYLAATETIAKQLGI